VTYSVKSGSIKPSSTLALSARANGLRAAGRAVLNFTVGEPDFRTPAHIAQAGIQAIIDGKTRYTPSSGTESLRRAICRKLKDDNGLEYRSDQIVVSNGAKHSLYNIFTAVLNEGDEVLIPAPYWLSYPEMVKLAGGTPAFVCAGPENGFKPTVRQLEAACTPRTKAVIINSPNNPTGCVYSRAELEGVAEFALRRGLLVISDEIYEKLIYDADAPHVSIASLGGDIFKQTVVVNGVSKSYAMTGWRIGYTASSGELAEIMGNIQSHCASNPNSIAQEAALAAIAGPQDCVEEMRAGFERRRDCIYGRLSGIKGIKAARPQGAFYVFADVSEICASGGFADAAAFSERLLDDCGVAVVPCADFGMPGFVRFSFSLSLEEITKGMDLLEEFAKKRG